MKRVQKILSVLLLAALGLFGLWQFFRDPSAFSPTERRPLAPKPKFSAERLLDGDFAKDSSKWLADQIAFRDFWLSLKGEAQKRAGQADNGRVYFAEDGYFAEIHEHLDEAKLLRNLGDMEHFAKTYFAEEKKPSYLVLAPTLAGLSPELLPPADLEARQAPLLEELRARAEAGGLMAPDLLGPMRAAEKEGRALYFKTDHHWTQHGARVAFEAWRRAAGKPEEAEPAYQVELKSRDFVGTTAAKGLCFSFQPDVIESYEAELLSEAKLYDQDGTMVRRGIYDPAALEGYDQYTYFVADNKPWLKIETGARAGGHLLMFKDSYANAFVPFLCPYYESITMVDLRYTKEKMDDLLARGLYDELMFLFNAVTLAEDNNTFKLLQ